MIEPIDDAFFTGKTIILYLSHAISGRNPDHSTGMFTGDSGKIRCCIHWHIRVICRGEASPSSDIDIVVEFNRPIGWEFVDLADFLESRLHHKVDLVIRRSLHPLIRDAILSEVQYV